MGCFDINGGISRLPVTYGDDCFLMIGVINKNIRTAHIDEYGNGFLFTPISLPVFGKYNDYGRIEEIVRDKNVEITEMICEEKIDKIIDAIDNNLIGRYSKTNEFEKLCNRILDKFNIDKNQYELGISIDHKFIYDTISDLQFDDLYINFEQSLEVTKRIPYTIEECLKNTEFKEKYDLDDRLMIYDISHLFIKIRKEYLEEHKIETTGFYPSYESRIMNLNPNYEEGIYRTCEYFDTYMFMKMFKEDNTKFLFENLSSEYIKFLNFFYKMRILDWNTPIHRYSGQCGYEFTCVLKTYFENILKFINNKIEKYE